MLNFSKVKDALDDIDFDINLPLMIGISAGLSVMLLALVILAVYYSFYGAGEGSIFLGSNFNIPGEFDDEEALLNDENTYLSSLDQAQRDNYFDGKEFQKVHLPITKPLGLTLSESDIDYITDRGIQAYIFEQPNELIKIGIAPTASIEDKLDVRFINTVEDEPNSVILNYPLPININDSNLETIYFEVKIFELSPESKVSIGLSSKPYPLFRLPGYNKYSIAYESDGTVRINQPFYSPSVWDKLIEGDVVGVGFKPRSGTVFFTHNGKKVLEAAHNVKFDLYPIIGSIGPSKLETNIGQIGFVFIEANVKKWGFGTLYGTIGIPPAYGKETNKDTVIDQGEILPPRYPSEEETFFGPPGLLTDPNVTVLTTTEGGSSETQKKHTKLNSKPPSYTDEPKKPIKNDTPVEVVDEVTERLYERRSSTYDLANNHYDPLSSNSNISVLKEPVPKEPIKSRTSELDTTNDTRSTSHDDVILGTTDDLSIKQNSLNTPQDSESDKQTSPEPVSSDNIESTSKDAPQSSSSKSNKNKKKKKKGGKKKGKK